MNQINDESLKSEDEYETCINKLKELNEKSKVSSLAFFFVRLFVFLVLKFKIKAKFSLTLYLHLI